MEATDADVIARARTGDSDAFRVLVERHGRLVFRVAFRMTGNEQDAEDVVQETFLRAYKQIGNFDARASFSTWLYTIATNCSLDLIRSRNRRSDQHAHAPAEGDDPLQSIASPEPTPERHAMSSQVRERVADALNELTAAERSAFVLRHFEGLRIEQISQALGCGAGAARHSVFRAVQKLRRALEPVTSMGSGR